MPINTAEYKKLIQGAKAQELIVKPFTIPARIGISGDDPTPEVTEADMLTQIQKLDSIHDFGSSRGSNIATDLITKRKSDTAYIYNSMRMTYIQKYSFNNGPIGIQDIPIINFSSLSYPGVAAETRAIDDIENYCVLLAMKSKMKDNAGLYNTFFKHIPLTDAVPDYSTHKTAIKNFFNEYTDNVVGTGKINFIVDTPGDMSKILKSNAVDDFAYILTQESAHDSASSKSSPLAPTSITECYKNNGYVEVLNFDQANNFYKYNNNTKLDDIVGEKQKISASIKREYSNTYDDGTQNKGKFESHFIIKFDGMKYNSVKDCYYTEVQYSNNLKITCNLNQKPHPTNVNTIVTEIKKVFQTAKVLEAVDKTTLVANKKNKFSEDFSNNADYGLSGNDGPTLDYTFTKKRAGDGLQAKVVKLVNSGKLVLYCNKQINPGGIQPDISSNNKGNTNIEIIYKIQRLVLVTIDRVLFSYCVTNNIPVILSGPKYLLLFKPNPGPGSAVMVGGGSNHKLSIKNNINLKMNNNFDNKSINKKNNIISKKNIQKGGNIDKIKYLFQSVPYCFLKLLPRLLVNQAQKDYVIREISGDHNEKKILSVFIDNKSCVYRTDLNNGNNEVINGTTYGYCEFLNKELIVNFTGKFIVEVFLDRYVYTGLNNETTDILFSELNGKINTGIENYYNIRSSSGISIDDFDAFMQSIDPEYVPPGYEPDMYEGGSISNDQESNERGMSIQSSTSNDRMSIEGESLNDRFWAENMPGLNLYLQFFYNNNISSNKNSLTLDENLLVTNNNIAIMSYLSLFNSFEMNMCWDNDGYDENFNNIKGLEVTNKISLYLFIYHLLLDFETQKDKICYGLLEYFIQPKNSSDSYFIIEDDLSSLIHYVTCSYVNLPLSVNKIIENMIDAEIIKTDNQIFTNTRDYFMQLGDKIHNHNIMISEYLNNESDVEGQDQGKIVDFINKYLNMYGFMMMSDIFYANNDEKPEESEEKKKENEYLRKNKMIGGLKISKKRNIKNRHKRGNKTKNLRKTKKTKKTKKRRKIRNKKTKKGKK